MNPTMEWKKTLPGSTEAVQFTDGMLVTAEDLGAAMRYPLSVIQVLLKAYFGCGIVCGLELTDKSKEKPNGEPRADGTPATRPPPECDPNFIVTIGKGVALGCDGYPIEICGPLELDLTPDPCRSDREPKEMFVAARRVTAAEAASRPCGCGPTGGEQSRQCTRVRDHALVQAFEKDRLPPELCRSERSPPKKDGEGTGRDPTTGQRPAGVVTPCDCLKACGDCSCCGEPWVLLGSVRVGKEGLGDIDPSGRRFVKPIACICATSERDQAPATNRAETDVDETSTGEASVPVVSEA